MIMKQCQEKEKYYMKRDYVVRYDKGKEKFIYSSLVGSC
jgi:hypothetical protein